MQRHNVFSKKRVILFIFFVAFLMEISGHLLGLGDPPLVELDNSIEYMLKPNSNYERFGNRISVNRYRMRSEDFEPEKTPDELRVIIFGDSVVYGTHHTDQANTISSTLKKRMSDDNRWSKVTVGSVAAISWGPANILAFVNRFGTFNGDIAVLVLSRHDLYDAPFADNRPIPYRTRPSLSAAHDLGQLIVERVKKQLVPNTEKISKEKRKQISVQALWRLIEVLKRDFAGVYLLYHPNRSGFERCENKAITAYEDISKQFEIEFKNLCDAYENAMANNILIYEDGIHLAKGGSKTLSAVITNIIENGPHSKNMSNGQ